jgi:hypothetical protein
LLGRVDQATPTIFGGWEPVWRMKMFMQAAIYPWTWELVSLSHCYQIIAGTE